MRQGCPLSPYLFILSAEILAKSIRKNTDIKGLHVKNNEIKISQYADDTTLLLDRPQKSLSEALKVLKKFRKALGLRLNSKKAEALWLVDSCAGRLEKLCPEENFNWKDSKIMALRISLSIDPEKTINANFLEKNSEITQLPRLLVATQT